MLVSPFPFRLTGLCDVVGNGEPSGTKSPRASECVDCVQEDGKPSEANRHEPAIVAYESGMMREPLENPPPASGRTGKLRGPYEHSRTTDRSEHGWQNDNWTVYRI